MIDIFPRDRFSVKVHNSGSFSFPPSMHRRPSAASTVSLSSQSHGQSIRALSILGSSNGRLRSPPTRSISLHTVIDPPEENEENATINNEADELFTTHPVSEIKNIQRRLRTEADAKQEELRLMVGERYRDLLQASTSIIAIAQSSEQVLSAFDEAKEIISSQEIPRTHRGSSPDSKNDSNLQTFQSLGAHMKLLLDAPEHLWRLIERKEYFRAAWLFLLAGVVHRALIDDDAEESMNWRVQGINVADQFPLVQRQWETIVQFRPQISHKATLSLRDPAATVEVCATLLTLYLLDSRPLAEALSIFLTQRSRTLSAILSKTIDFYFDRASVMKPNGQPLYQNSSKTMKNIFKEVQQSIEASLDVISRTLGTSRAIFEKQFDADHSLMTLALDHIQPDATALTRTLPSELKLTTQLLLANLPSSTHFLLLPTSIKSYKPYVDLSSPSSSFPQPILTTRLEGWFHKAMQELSQTLIVWFSALQSMKEVWRLRSWSQKWIISAQALQDHERRYIASVVDDACKERLTSIWKASLTMAKTYFERELTLAVQEKGKSSYVSSSSGSLPLPFLLQAPPPPLSSSTLLGPSQANASLRKYKSALRRQVTGRAPLLEQVLEPIEKCAESLQKDLNSLKAECDDTSTLINQLLTEYKPEAEVLCLSVADALKTAVDKIDDKPEGAGATLIFISNLIEELSSSSNFVDHLGCEKHVTEVFHNRIRELHHRLVDRWRVHTLTRISQEYWRMCSSSTAILKDVNAGSLTRSPAAIKSLLALSTALQEFGSILDPSRRDAIAKETLIGFLEAMIDLDDAQKLHANHRWTILFLQKLLDVWDTRWMESAASLQTKSRKIIGTDIRAEEDAQLSAYLAGTQTLLASLFPTIRKESTFTGKVDKVVALLPHGIPTAVQDSQPTMNIVKPSPRFGLLLVGSTAVR